MSRPGRGRLEILHANIEDDPTPRQLLDEIDRWNPDMLSLNQASRARDFLEEIDGYRLRQFGRHHGPEAPGIAVLVRDDLKVLNRWPMRMRQEWVGPKAGKHHEPRVYPILRVEKDGVQWPTAHVHWPTHNNPKAQEETERRLVRWAKRHERAVIVGDFNRRDVELRSMADELDGVLLSTGKVDHLIARGVSGARKRGLRAPRDAHGWGVYVLEAA